MASTTTTDPKNLASIFKWASKDGEFKRQVSSFRDIISSEPGAKFPPAADRYHLYVSHACPWAHRVMVVRALKGLEKVLPISVVDYLLGEGGWHFSDPETTPGSTIDSLYNSKFLSELYFKAEPNYSGRFTVPVLWDKQNQTIVNNESSEIIRILNTAFDEWSSKSGVTYYPEHLSKEIDEVNSWVYDSINNGVYKTGFATTQSAYDGNVVKVFEGLDRVEAILSKSDFLVGNTFTEADIRLFTTMIRFDPVYHTHFKCTKKTVTANYPNILRLLRRIYQMSGVAETVNMTHIKRHYYMSHIQINPYRIVPSWDGPDLSVKP